MNLPQALAQMRSEQDTLLHLDVIRTMLAKRDLYKSSRYFHECSDTCVTTSPRYRDHTPLPGKTEPTCRVLYRKSLQFFRAGLTHKERLFLAANRIGKTETAAYEVSSHLTGEYPDWWPGKKILGPNKWWAAGDTRQTTRDIVQQALMGPHQGVPVRAWAGMIPPHLIVDIVRSSGGVSDCLDTIYVQHVERHHGAPCISELAFKSYDQGRRVFQGAELNGGVWLDEEPPDPEQRAEGEAQGSSEIYTECLLRLMTTEGVLISTFTPLRGMTPFLNGYMATAVMPGTDEDDVPAKDHFFPGLISIGGSEAGA